MNSNASNAFNMSHVLDILKYKCAVCMFINDNSRIYNM